MKVKEDLGKRWSKSATLPGRCKKACAPCQWLSGSFVRRASPLFFDAVFGEKRVVSRGRHGFFISLLPSAESAGTGAHPKGGMDLLTWGFFYLFLVVMSAISKGGMHRFSGRFF